jgi:hypothetical protein
MIARCDQRLNRLARSFVTTSWASSQAFAIAADLPLAVTRLATKKHLARMDPNETHVPSGAGSIRSDTFKEKSP